ncbi:polysaccharide deacetylase [Robertmurraya sp. DFI.2.37]|jgi:peptidoglycan/xylan/chitin deacetylase (PgdA/CDA1 family)|uniref:polysaccharide deacetylase family protein n=1 Tax=Robertmurraya sp. DFI.2.37 TaxID=3031819 RepID=UPI0023DB6A4C|nr:polysaccharide deacetylase family protein [Robertmurraya sp. DFI.2.37]MDF1510057.1 polysaccharide deacetylase [Robertmurraya sp. DFI.2.37]
MSSSQRKRYKLNVKGKITVFILTILMVSLCVTWAGKVVGQMFDLAKEDTKIAEAKIKDADSQQVKDVIEKDVDEDTGRAIIEDEEREELELGKVVYLTFDDGPHSTASEKILNLLNQYNAKATYFMLKPNIEQNSAMVEKVAESGHSIGAHGVTHDVSKIYQSPGNFVAEMNETLAAIFENSHLRSRLIRAPYGSKPYITQPFREAIEDEQFILWDWNIDSEDWKMTKGQYVNNVIQQVNQYVGKRPLVILLHEKPTTANHLEKLLSYFHKNGYEMKAIDESMKPLQFKVDQ